MDVYVQLSYQAEESAAADFRKIKKKNKEIGDMTGIILK